MTDLATGASPATPEPIATAIDNSSSSIQVTPTITLPEISSNPIAPVAAVNPIAPTETANKGSSILPKEAPTEIKWPENWQKALAGEDPKALREAEKYKNPGELLKAKLELQDKFSKTRPLPQLAKDATPEQVKEYREAAGIPESWDKYDLTLDKGLVIGEADKPMVDNYLQKFHDANLKNDDVKKVLQIHFEAQNEQAAQAIKIAEDHQKQTVESLRQQLGPKYDESLNMATEFLKNNLGNETFEKLRGAVAPDGTYLLNDLKVLNHFIEAGKNQFGNPTHAPSKGAEMTGLLGRKTELEKIHASNPKIWYENRELAKEYEQIQATLIKK